jgi:hypothetical protein
MVPPHVFPVVKQLVLVFKVFIVPLLLIVFSVPPRAYALISRIALLAIDNVLLTFTMSLAVTVPLVFEIVRL